MMIQRDLNLILEPSSFGMGATAVEIATPSRPDWHRLGFPQRLHHLLNFLEYSGLGHMAHWGHVGTCFRIRKTEEFVRNILPYFFQQNKWKSFQRQINIYDFKRIPSGPYKGFYRHPYFSKSDMSMAHKILRKKQRSEMSAHLPQGRRYDDSSEEQKPYHHDAQSFPLKSSLPAVLLQPSLHPMTRNITLPMTIFQFSSQNDQSDKNCNGLFSASGRYPMTSGMSNFALVPDGGASTEECITSSYFKSIIPPGMVAK